MTTKPVREDWEKSINKIINGIGSPYGEGAEYNSTDDDSPKSIYTHLDDCGIERLRADLLKLLTQTKSQIVEQIKEIEINTDSKHQPTLEWVNGYWKAIDDVVNKLNNP